MIEANQSYPPELVLDDREHSKARGEWEGDQAEVDGVPAYYKRRTAGIWTCLATLAVAVGLAGMYGYTVLEQQGIQLEQIPGVTKSLPAISQHLASLENRMVDTRTSEQKLAARVHTIDAESKSAILETRQQTSGLVAQVQRNLGKQFVVQNAALQNQVAALASDRSAERVRLTQMEAMLAQQRTELESAKADYVHELAEVREQQGLQHRELVSISSSLPTHQVNFDMLKNQQVEVADGVKFQLTKTDVSRQRFDGWIESSLGRQRVSVQNQGVRTPIMFFPSSDSKAVMIVVTRITDAGGTGYVLSPSGTYQSVQADAATGADNVISPVSMPAIRKSAVTDR